MDISSPHPASGLTEFIRGYHLDEPENILCLAVLLFLIAACLS
jgi:hypothetical protein